MAGLTQIDRQNRNDAVLIATVLQPLTEPGAALRPGLDDRMMIVMVPRGGVSLARKTVSHRDIERLLARGWVRKEPKPSRQLVITLAGERAVSTLTPAPDSPLAAREPVYDPASGNRHLIDRRENPLAWLARRKNADGTAMIDPLQLAAGERLRSDFTLAGLSPRMTIDWTRFGAGTSSGIGHPGLATDVMLAARQRLHAALDALGPDYAGLALDVCCFLKGIGEVERERGWRQRSARHQLYAALSRLVVHYGFGAQGPMHSSGILAWAEP